MKLRKAFLASSALLLILTGCASPAPAASPSATATPSAAAPSETPSASGTPAAEDPGGVIGTVVRFTGDSVSVDVTIDEDTPATRDFLSMLPLSLDLTEFNGREKIAYLPRPLNYEGTSGFDPEDGDLIYFTPWGNLGFYYNTTGIGYSDSTLRIGTYTATLDELNQLEGPGVRIEVVE